jgi:hypothetical protein
MTPEQQAPQSIDARLLASGWIVQDYTKMDLSGNGFATGRKDISDEENEL